MVHELYFCRELSSVANVRDMTPMSNTFHQFIFFGTGAQDDNCPFVGRFDTLGATGTPMCSFPSDKHYFELLWSLVSAATNNWAASVGLYSDMQYLFRRSGVIGRPGQHVDPEVIDWIRFRSQAYFAYADMFTDAALMVYYGMVSENCRVGTRLGARMKLNGIYELLFGERRGDVEFAAGCERGVDAAAIGRKCWLRGIYLPDGGVAG